MYNIQENFGHYNELPVCNTVKKILIGKLFTFQSNKKRQMVILDVRRNNLYGYFEILVGAYNGYTVDVMSWYCYYKRDFVFVGRDTKRAIRNCLKYNPKYISLHIGKSIDITKTPIFDKYKLYKV